MLQYYFPVGIDERNGVTGSDDIIVHLLSRGADAQVQVNGVTALMLAVEHVSPGHICRDSMQQSIARSILSRHEIPSTIVQFPVRESPDGSCLQFDQIH